MAEIGRQLCCQSDRDLPRTYFRSGYIPVRNKEGQRNSYKRSGQEIPGVMLVCLLFLLTNEKSSKDIVVHRIGMREMVRGESRRAILCDEDEEYSSEDEKMYLEDDHQDSYSEGTQGEEDVESVEDEDIPEDVRELSRVERYVHLFDRCLLLGAFLKQKRIKKSSIGRLLKFMRCFVTDICLTVERPGMGMNLRKTHYLLHVPEDIVRFGSPRNTWGAPAEAMFKRHKKNARKTQQRAHTMDFQFGVRTAEDVALSRGIGELRFNEKVDRGVAERSSRAAQRRRFLLEGSSTRGNKKEREAPEGLGEVYISLDFSPVRELDEETGSRFLTGQVEVCNWRSKRVTKKEAAEKECWASDLCTFEDLISVLKHTVSPLLLTAGVGEVPVVINEKRKFLRVNLHKSYTPSVENNSGFNRQSLGAKFSASPFTFPNGKHHWAKAVVSDGVLTMVHLIAFFSIQGDSDIPDNLLGGQPSLSGPVKCGDYAVVQFVPEDPFGERKLSIYGNDDDNYRVSQNCNIAVWASKDTGRLERNAPLTTQLKSRLKPVLQVISAEAIVDTAIAYNENDSDFPFTYIFVRPIREWASVFDNIVLEDLLSEEDSLKVAEDYERDILQRNKRWMTEDV